MIDYTSVDAFARTLPDVSPGLQEVLFLTPYAPDAFAPGSALAASRGYLGCPPFAAIGKDQRVLRLLPGQPLERCPVAVAWGEADVTDGHTIASRPGQFVAGRLMQMDPGNPEQDPLTPEIRVQLMALASEFGDPASCRRLLAALAQTVPQDYCERCSFLHDIADPHDPPFSILSVAESDREIEDKIA